MTATPTSPIMPKRTVQAATAYVPPLEGRRSKTRLDFNENTEGFADILPADVDITHINTYPEYTHFLQQLAKKVDIPESHLLLTNGSDEALAVLANTFIEPGQDSAIISKPSFPLIGHYLALADATITTVGVNADLTHNVTELTQALESAYAKNKPPKLLICASPDNPTGALLDPNVMLDWSDRFSQTLFVMDEAYADYCGVSLLPELRKRLARGQENLMMTRTFSKAWALAGLRLGFVVGAPRLIEAMTIVRSPYSVNTMAVKLATELLPKAEAVHQQAQATMARKASLIQALKDRGYNVVPGSGNFFLLQVGLDAKPLTTYCANHGILLRDRSVVPELSGMVRISVGTEAENQRFLNTLDAFHQSRVLLFDLDGTLIDTTGSFDKTVEALISHFAPDQPLNDGELEAIRMEGGYNDDWDATHELLKRRGVTEDWNTIAKEGVTLYLQLAPQAETLMVTTEWLQQLRKRYPKLGIVTGRYRNEYDTTWAERLNPLFDVVVCRDDLPDKPGKPAPDPLLYACQQLNLDSEQAFKGYYVGNSADDMMASVAAHLVAVGVATTQSAESLHQVGATIVAAHPSELESLFLPQPLTTHSAQPAMAATTAS